MCDPPLLIGCYSHPDAWADPGPVIGCEGRLGQQEVLGDLLVLDLVVTRLQEEKQRHDEGQCNDLNESQ